MKKIFFTIALARDSIITLAKYNGIKVEERRILITEVIEAFNKGILKDECIAHFPHQNW